MKTPLKMDDCIRKLSREIIAQADQGTITLGFVERTLAEFAEHIRREAESQ